MRIAILSNTFPPDGKGGAEQVAALQTEGLKKAGHEVRVWSCGGRPRGTAHVRAAGDGFDVTRFPSKQSLKRGVTGLPHVVLTAARLFRVARGRENSSRGRNNMGQPGNAPPPLELAQMHPVARLWFHLVTDSRPRTDVVHEILAWKPEKLITHNLTGCGIATPRAIQSHGITWTHILHDIQLTDPSGQETDAWSKTMLARGWRACWSAHRRAVFGRPDMLVSPTAWLLGWHRRHRFHGNAEKIIPNPVDMAPSRIRALTIPATVVYIGRLSRHKGFDLFLDVVQRLPASLVNQITVVGDGSLRADAVRLADPRIDLVGLLPSSAVHAILADADLLIAPSRLLENQQNILLEAMAAGTPVVATDVGGTRETLEGTGCPTVLPGRLLEETTRLLSDARAWNDMSRKMQERARDRHAASTVLFDT